MIMHAAKVAVSLLMITPESALKQKHRQLATLTNESTEIHPTDQSKRGDCNEVLQYVCSNLDTVFNSDGTICGKVLSEKVNSHLSTFLYTGFMKGKKNSDSRAKIE